MHILLSGGGTLGPVIPLLALVDAWHEKTENPIMTFVGTRRGPERAIVERMGLKFVPMTSVKAPRYWTWYWLVMPFFLLVSLVEAWRIIRREKPDVVVTAGGFVSVPLVWVAWLHRVPIWMHQQDVLPGLANKLMAPFARTISVAFPSSASAFSAKKTQVLGNPVRAKLYKGNAEKAAERFGLSPDKMTILVLGGGTGSAWLNMSADAIADTLVSEGVQVIHLTGKGKAKSLESRPGYAVEELITEGLEDIYALADIVLCRAGLGTLTELAALGKTALVVPMPDSHQEANALFLFEQRAAVILDQNETTPQVLLAALRSLYKDDSARRALGGRLRLCFPPDARAPMAAGILALAQTHVQKQAKAWAVVSPTESTWSSRNQDEMTVETAEQDESSETSEITDESDRLNAQEQQVVLSIEEQIARALEEGREKKE